MKLSTAGAIAQGFWFEIPKHYDHVQLGEFVVMPNHLHGVLILDSVETLNSNVSNPKPDPDGNVQTLNSNVSDPDVKETLGSNVSTPTTGTGELNREFFRKISPKSGSVSRMIGQYKRICKIHINKAFPDMNFDWQERFHDHIIRTEQSFFNISNYIIENPERWEQDKFFDMP